MASQITHHILPYFAGFALIAFLYIPVYSSLMQIRAEVTSVRKGLYNIKTDLGFKRGSRAVNSTSTGNVAIDADNSVDVIPAVRSIETPAIGSVAVDGNGTSPKRWRSINVDKVMKLCESEDCMKSMQNFELYTVDVDPMAFEQKYCGKDKVFFHLYWDGHMDDRTAMIIRSFLYTQDQQCTQMIVWTMNAEAHECLNTTSTAFRCNGYDRTARNFRRNVEFRIFDLPKELAQLSKFIDKSIDVEYVAQRARNGLDFSDILRFTVLSNYGGVYIDADVLLLRDFSVLFEHEFAYVWAYHDACNTAIIRLMKESQVGRTLIRAAIDNSYKFYPLDLGNLEHLRNLPLPVLPVKLFDSVWLENDDKELPQPPGLCFRFFHDAFTKPCNRSSLDGAFAYHWHNNYKTRIEEGSFMWSWMSFLEQAVP